ncbi:MAG: hypothetical protein PHQ74_14980 [Crocinitomicaceae bacterium]|nr:hypothetical protein [Crocinitomicaceae bacterium]
MEVKANQSHIDLTVLGYGDQSAFFELAKNNTTYDSTIEEPYSTVELPFDFEVGDEIFIDETSEFYNADQLKILNKTKLKCATKDENF